MSEKFRQTVASDRLREIYEVWSKLAEGRIGPRRSEVKLSLLGRNIVHTFFVDVIASTGDFRFGFAGDRIMQFLGTHCATPNLSGLRSAQFFDAAYELFVQCVATAKPLVSGPKPTHYKGKEHLERQVLILPLSDDNRTVEALLGAFDTWQLGTNHHRFAPVLAD